MELTPGYKQSGVGVIPEDWNESTVGEYITFEGGSQPDKSYFRLTQKPGYCRLIQIRDYKTDNFEVFVPKFLARRFCDENDIMIGRYGPPVFQILRGLAGAYNVALIKAVPGEGLDREFAYYFLTQDTLFRFIDKLSRRTSGQTGVDLKELRSYPLPLPPTISEQRSIATALSDVDALLDGLDRLIAKKRDLKQAAMQQLLTGKTRLPGFEDEWELKRLGDHVTFLRNGVNSRAELTLDDPVKYLHYGDIHSCTSVMLDPASLPSLPSGKAKNLDRLCDGDLVFADASEDLVGVSKSVEICGASSTEIVSGLHTIAARFDKDVLADGFKAYLQFCPVFSGQLRRLSAGTKVYATNRSHIASVEMRLPGIKEQEAIAAIFNDMDAEIAALEQRRNKTKDIKQAMMQELLTGKTRLL
jgi:type I restriction enzyme S subunit